LQVEVARLMWCETCEFVASDVDSDMESESLVPDFATLLSHANRIHFRIMHVADAGDVEMRDV
jgi:hypothetical protein